MNNKQITIKESAAEITKSLLPDLEKLSKCASEPVVAVFIDSLLRRMRFLHDNYMDSPYTEVVMALHVYLHTQIVGLTTPTNSIKAPMTC